MKTLKFQDKATLSRVKAKVKTQDARTEIYNKDMKELRGLVRQSLNGSISKLNSALELAKKLKSKYPKTVLPSVVEYLKEGNVRRADIALRVQYESDLAFED